VSNVAPHACCMLHDTHVCNLFTLLNSIVVISS
jgi:hypothetical protein